MNFGSTLGTGRSSAAALMPASSPCQERYTLTGLTSQKKSEYIERKIAKKKTKKKKKKGLISEP